MRVGWAASTWTSKRVGDDAAAHARAEVQVKAGDGQRRDGVGDHGGGDAEVDERGDDHVAGEAAGGVEEEDLPGAGAAGEAGRGRGGRGRGLVECGVVPWMGRAVVVVVIVIVRVVVVVVGRVVVVAQLAA